MSIKQSPKSIYEMVRRQRNSPERPLSHLKGEYLLADENIRKEWLSGGVYMLYLTNPLEGDHRQAFVASPKPIKKLRLQVPAAFA